MYSKLMHQNDATFCDTVIIWSNSKAALQNIFFKMMDKKKEMSILIGSV